MVPEGPNMTLRVILMRARRGRGFAVVEFRAGELTAVAGNAQIGVGDDEALGRFENHVRPHAVFGSRIV